MTNGTQPKKKVFTIRTKPKQDDEKPSEKSRGKLRDKSDGSSSSRSNEANAKTNDGVERSPSASMRGGDTTSLLSQVSIGMDPGVGNLSQNRFFDVIQVALICRPHRAMLFAKMLDSKGIYFPFVTFNSGK